jgi:hypothetical protein
MEHRLKQCDTICKKINIPRPPLPSILTKIYKNLAIQFSKERPTVPDAVLRLSNPWSMNSVIFDSIPAEIRDYIRASKTSKSIQYTFVLPSGRTIHLKLWSPSSKKDIHSRIADIQSWFHFLDPFVPTECSQELTIYLYWTSHTKNFPASSARSSKTTQILLDVVHVNSAFTYHCRKQNEIFIFREEEWFRALIHESMHAFGMDFSDMNTMNLTKKLKKEAFPGILCTDLGIYEAYTETWAEILVILIRVCKTTQDLSSVKTMIQNYLYYEKCWAMSQATKVLRFYNVSYQDLLDGTLYQEDRVKVFSYYIIKAILMTHVEAFISWCSHHNHHSMCFIFDPSDDTRKKSMNAFCTLIVDFAKDPEFLEQMKQMDDITTSNISGDSLRMSLFG